MGFAIQSTDGYKVWEIKDSKPYFSVSTVISIEADGKELEYIENHFKNLPISTRTTCRWRGEMAQFIFENL